MTDYSPFPFRWTGEAMTPLTPHWQKKADERFVIGERYLFVEHQDRSIESHRHQFAWLKEAWQQLPEQLADLYPTPEHLRARALIDAGYYHEEAIDCGSTAAALRVAAFIRRREDFSLVIVRGPIVLVRTPKSQSYRAMGKREFQESKTAIMEIIENMIGAEPGALSENAGKAA